LLSRETQFSAAGLDGDWFTSDDVVDTYIDYSYGLNDNKQSISECRDPGPDSIWFNSDDILSEQIIYYPDF
jgi:hypothetical protein